LIPADFVGDDDIEMQDVVREQSEMAIDEADLILGIFDGVYGVHEDDSIVTDVLRKSNKPVLWVVNKCEKPATEVQASEFYALGMEDISCISAAHYLGVQELVKRMMEWISSHNQGVVSLPERDGETINVAIIGRPNVGKSTLLNRLTGESRLVTSPISGTTRDSIDIEMTRNGQRYVITDTAGLRKKARIEDGTVERYSNLRTLRSLVKSDVAVLLIDATTGIPTEQDTKLAGLIHERGRGFVIVINKWDAIEKDHTTVKEYELAVRSTFKFAPYAPILFISALTGRRCPSIFDAAKAVVESSRERIQTSQLNKTIRAAFQKRPPPVYRGEPIKFYFATQISVAPPTLVLVVNYPRRINFSYERYVRNRIREEFPFEGSDIRIIWRKRSDKNDPEARAEQ
jgi:GTP-binding protein